MRLRDVKKLVELEQIKDNAELEVNLDSMIIATDHFSVFIRYNTPNKSYLDSFSMNIDPESARKLHAGLSAFIAFQQEG